MLARMTDRRLGSHSPGMTMLRLLAGSVVLSLLTLLGGCDRGFDPDVDPSDLDDLDEDDAEGLWARELAVGEFLYEETSVHVWGDCTTTKTTEIAGNGECSSGAIGVGFEQPDGTLVSGAIALCGTLTWTEEHSSSFCGTNSSGTFENGPAVFDLSAATADDPIVFSAPHDDPDLVISTTIFAASAIEEPGTTKTVRLDGSATSEDGLDSKEISVVVDFVVK